MHNLSTNFKLKRAMDLVFEPFGAISSWMWTASIIRLPIILGRFRESLAKILTLESTGMCLRRFCVELNRTNSFWRFPDEIRSVPPADRSEVVRSTCSQPNSLLSLRLVISLHYFDSEIFLQMDSWVRLNLFLF